MEYVRPLTEMLDIYTSLDPSFIEMENLKCVTECEDEFVYLLGVCFCKNDLEGIKTFTKSRMWFTYRKNFPAIGGTGPTSDAGWGCMLRCGQMLLAHALSVVHLGRNWQWQPKCADPVYRRLLSMFEDQRSSLFSIHQIAQMGVSEGKNFRDWFGPNTIAQVLKKLVVYDDWSRLAVHVAMDNILISSDVRVMADHDHKKKTDDSMTVSSTSTSAKWKRPILIIVPLRLGLTIINSCYSNAIKEFFKLPQCAGIVGGRPDHAVYFYGQVGNKMLFLDPHVSQNTIDVSFGEEKERRRRHRQEMQDPRSVHNHDPSRATSALSTISTTPSEDVDVYEGDDPLRSIKSAPVSSTLECGELNPADDVRTQELDSAYIDVNIITKNERNVAFATSGKTNSNLDNNDNKKFGKNIENTYSSSNSIVEVLSSPGGKTSEMNSSAENEMASSNESSSNFVDAANQYNHHNNIYAMSLKKNSKIKPSRALKIASISSYSVPSSEFSSYTDVINDTVQKFELESREVFVSPPCVSPDGCAERDRELVELPEITPADINLQLSLSFCASSSSSSTEILPSISKTNTNHASSTTHTSYAMTHLVNNMEIIHESKLNNVVYDTTTEDDERKDEASYDSENETTRSSSQKRKLLKHKRKIKRKISNETFKDAKSCSDTEFEDSRLTCHNKIMQEKAKDTINWHCSQIKASFPTSNSENPIESDGIKKEDQTESTTNKEEIENAAGDKNTKNSEANVADEKKDDTPDDFDDTSFHCSHILSMNFDTLDPSLALAFICMCADDYNDLIDRLTNSVLPASSPPLFEILDSRPTGWPDFVPYAIHDESLKIKEYDDFGDPQFDSDDQFEILE